MIFHYNSSTPKVAAPNSKIEEGIVITIDMINALANIGNSELFMKGLKDADDNSLFDIIKYCSETRAWNEGVLLCEREIARRGLHVTDNEKRFDL